MINKHLIDVRYIATTSTRPSRVSLKSPRFKDRVVIPYDHAYNDITDMAAQWLIANGYTIFCRCETEKGYGVLVNEFISLADAKAGKRWHNGLVS
jgi:hypothetical protein